MVEHKGIANLKVVWEESFGISPRDRIGFLPAFHSTLRFGKYSWLY
ncbi:hypothetical protein P7H17_03505 [Paenibacillus larvae]|nr:hypothetical protein [Paenibacillus larvae]MDT2285350.1 hypothetical protein [Paenibacillus larvae]